MSPSSRSPVRAKAGCQGIRLVLSGPRRSCIGREEHIMAHSGTSIAGFGRTCQAQHDSGPDGLRTDCDFGPMKGSPAAEAHVQPWPVPCSSSPRNSALALAAWLLVVCAVTLIHRSSAQNLSSPRTQNGLACAARRQTSTSCAHCLAYMHLS